MKSNACTLIRVSIWGLWKLSWQLISGFCNAYEFMSEAKQCIGVWIDYYINEQKHQALGATPDMMYDKFSGLRQAA